MMKININKHYFKRDPRNEVTNYRIFVPYSRGKNKNFVDNGLFSYKVFGAFYKCNCGNCTTIDQICDICKTRVIDPKYMPDFFIDLLAYYPIYDYDVDNLRKEVKELNSNRAFNNRVIFKDVLDIIEYKSFINSEGKVIQIETINDLNNVDNDILVGVEALKFIGISANWIENNLTDVVSISHPIYRPIIFNNNIIITEINKIYSDLLYELYNIKELQKCIPEVNKISVAVTSNKIYQILQLLYKNIVNLTLNDSNSLVKSDVISHPISSAVRAVVVNRADIHEDVILIGDNLVETLYPILFKKYNGDMFRINEEIIDKGYLVLVNRPPIISHLSAIAMKPRIASLYPYNGNTEYDYGLSYPDNFMVNDSVRDVNECFVDITTGEEFHATDANVVSVNPIMNNGLASDYDGDVFMVCSIFSKEANKEASTMLPSKSYLDYSKGNIRNKIVNWYNFSEDEDGEDHIEEYKNMKRGDYFAKNQELREDLHINEPVVTINDISNYLNNGGVNPDLNRVFNYFGDRENFDAILRRQDPKYDEDESSNFLKEVVASNSKDIGIAGMFYKYAMASCDDFRLNKSSCKSKGTEYVVDQINEDLYNFRINMMKVAEFKGYAPISYEKFIEKCGKEGVKKIHVFSPLECDFAFKRQCCSKCIGRLPSKTKYVGCFAVLMVTESATQNALSSMNKGVKKNTNEVLDEEYTYELSENGVKTWINGVVESLNDSKIQSRFYEILLLSRIHYYNNSIVVPLLKNSMQYSGNLFGEFAFDKKERSFKNMIEAKSFKDNSMKLGIFEAKI